MSVFLKRLKVGALWGGFSRGAVGLLTLAVSAVLARSLSVEALALFFLALPLVRFLSVIFSFGLPDSLQKITAIATQNGDGGAVAQAIKTAAKVFLIVAAPVIVIAAMAWPFIDANLMQNQLAIGGGLILLALAALRSIEDIGAAILRGVGRMRLGLLFTGVPREALFLGLLFFGWATTGAWRLLDVLSTYALISGAMAVWLAVLLARHARADHPPAHGATTPRGMAAISAPMMVHALLANLFMAIDIWILGAVHPGEDVALYGAAMRLVLLILFTLSVLNLVQPALFAALHDKRQTKKLALLARTAATASFLIGGAAGLVFLLFGPIILEVVFGAPFVEAWPVLAILTAGHMVNAALGSPGVLLQMSGHQTLLMRIGLFTLALNLLGNILVVEPYGGMGVAWVTAGSLTVQKLMLVWFAKRRVGVLTLPHPGCASPRFLKRLLRR